MSLVKVELQQIMWWVEPRWEVSPAPQAGQANENKELLLSVFFPSCGFGEGTEEPVFFSRAIGCFGLEGTLKKARRLWHRQARGERRPWVGSNHRPFG